MIRAIEKYYSIEEARFLLGFKCNKTVIEKLKAQEFGAEVVNLGSAKKPDYRIPASGLNFYLDRRRLFTESDSTAETGIVARTVGELRRKVNES